MQSLVSILLVLSAAAFALSAATSLWRRSKWGFAIVLASAAVFFISWLSLEWADRQVISLELIAMFSWLYLLIVYFFGIRHLMEAGIATNISHADFTEYLRQRRTVGLFAATLRALGPVLLVCLFVFLALALVGELG